MHTFDIKCEQRVQSEDVAKIRRDWHENICPAVIMCVITIPVATYIYVIVAGRLANL